MPKRAANRRPGAVAAGSDPDQLRSGSLLIYCRSSVTLSLLLFTSIILLLYSDLYVHLIRQTARAFVQLRVLPGAFFAIGAAGILFAAFRIRPALEKAAFGLLALNLLCYFLRRRAASHSDTYLILCVISLVLDLALLGVILAFYRRYPNLLKHLRARAGE
jgi:hypothetical protein